MLRFSIMAVVVGIAILGPTRAHADAETDAVNAIKEVGGKVFRDEKDPAGPIVNVVFKSGEDPVAEALPHLKALPKLRTVSFPYVKTFDDDCAKSLAKLPGLTSLTIVGTELTDRGMEYLAGLKNMETLQLSNNAITDAGIKHLAGMKRLRFLGLNTTKVTGASFGVLRNANDLERITLFNTPTNDVAVKHLVGFKSLKRIELKKTKVSEVGTAELKRALPELDIE